MCVLAAISAFSSVTDIASGVNGLPSHAAAAIIKPRLGIALDGLRFAVASFGLRPTLRSKTSTTTRLTSSPTLRLFPSLVPTTSRFPIPGLKIRWSASVPLLSTASDLRRNEQRPRQLLDLASSPPHLSGLARTCASRVRACSESNAPITTLQLYFRVSRPLLLQYLARTRTALYLRPFSNPEANTTS